MYWFYVEKKKPRARRGHAWNSISVVTLYTTVLVLISEIVWIVHGIWAQSFPSISCANNQRWLRKLWKETIEVTVVVVEEEASEQASDESRRRRRETATASEARVFVSKIFVQRSPIMMRRPRLATHKIRCSLLRLLSTGSVASQ